MLGPAGNIIIDSVKNLSFIDKYAGIVRVASYNDTIDSKQIKKTFPLSCSVDISDPTQEHFMDLCPDSKKKSVLYLEDNGCRFLKVEGHLYYFRGNVDLVCWMNLPLLGMIDCMASAKAVLSILSALPIQPKNNGIYQRFLTTPLGENPKSQNPFAKYSYDVSIHQLLMHPYDYFVLPLQIDFCIDKRCLTDFVPGNPVGCVEYSGNECIQIPMPKIPLTCATLSDCQVIKDILYALENLPAGFSCSDLPNCSTIQEINSTLESLQNQIDEITIDINDNIDVFTPTNGQILFTLSLIPKVNTTVIMEINGLETDSFTIVANVITFTGTTFSLSSTDYIKFKYKT